MAKVITLSGLRGMGVANPASVNCATVGGVSKVVDTPAGQVGVCVFPDGSSCEEWALYRKECVPGTGIAGATDDAEGKTYPKLLNFGIAAGAGALVGLVVAASKSKKFSSRAAGAGVGAALASLILVMTWPKQQGA